MVDTVLLEFEQIVGRHERKLYRLALRIVRNSEDAEEVVQDAFMRVYRALKSMPSAEHKRLQLTPWLFVITRNVALNRLRRKHPRSVSLDAVSTVDCTVVPNSSDQVPEFYLEQREHRELIELAMRELPKHLQRAARLRFLDGLSHVEIGKHFDIPVGTVKSHIHRAALMMRRILRAELRAA